MSIPGNPTPEHVRHRGRRSVVPAQGSKVEDRLHRRQKRVARVLDVGDVARLREGGEGLRNYYTCFPQPNFAYLSFCEAALHVKPHLIPSSNWTPVPRFSARSFTLLSALSVARLARRRMVGFDGRGRFLWRGSRPRPRTLIRAHPLFVSSGGSS